MSKCQHRGELDLKVDVTYMDDSNVHALQLSAMCKACGARMDFGRHLPMGASSRGPARAPENLGVILPFIAEGEQPSKEWGFFLSGPHLVDDETEIGRTAGLN